MTISGFCIILVGLFTCLNNALLNYYDIVPTLFTSYRSTFIPLGITPL